MNTLIVFNSRSTPGQILATFIRNGHTNDPGDSIEPRKVIERISNIREKSLRDHKGIGFIYSKSIKLSGETYYSSGYDIGLIIKNKSYDRVLGEWDFFDLRTLPEMGILKII